MGRNYNEKDTKILWGAHSICNHPDCHQRLVVEASSSDPAAVIGKVCHIVAHSDNGPRADPAFPESEREDPDNLILLCGTHHDMIDVQENTYTVDDVRSWKVRKDEWYRATLSDATIALTFDELRKIADTLVSAPPSTPPSIAPPTPPARKMAHNGLSSAVADYYRIGQLRFVDIEDYIANAATWGDPDFANRLIGGFNEQYDLLVARGLSGDALFESLVDWASGGNLAGFKRQAAGVAILSYLFITCDVFEREPTT